MRVTGWWKVTDVYHETGNIGVVVNPPIQSMYHIASDNGKYLLSSKCWMDWLPDTIDLGNDPNNLKGTVRIDRHDHSLTFVEKPGAGGRHGGDRLEFTIDDGNPRGSGGAGRG